MKYAGINFNDTSAAPGISLTFYTQGCPHHCPECHNPQTWPFDGGEEFTSDVLQEIIDGVCANGIQRTLCIMGGEPLCDENLFLTQMVISAVKEAHPNTSVYLWTGYVYEDLFKRVQYKKIKTILSQVDVLIDGPYLREQRDLTLPMRGSRNQRIIELDKREFF